MARRLWQTPTLIVIFLMFVETVSYTIRRDPDDDSDLEENLGLEPILHISPETRAQWDSLPPASLRHLHGVGRYDVSGESTRRWERLPKLHGAMMDRDSLDSSVRSRRTSTGQTEGLSEFPIVLRKRDLCCTLDMWCVECTRKKRRDH